MKLALKKIEGEVLLQVVFAASGEVRVERVVQGLGYGLDATAESAAHQIRFRPGRTRRSAGGFQRYRSHYVRNGILKGESNGQEEKLILS